MTFLDQLKPLCRFYPAGKIVPQYITRNRRRHAHKLMFGSDTWVVYTKLGHMLIVDYRKEQVLFRVKTGAKNLAVRNLTFVGNLGITDKEWSDSVERHYKEMNA